MTKEDRKPLGDKPELRWIDKNHLHVDDAYQRPANKHRASAMAEKFDWRFFGAAIVAEREDGSFWVPDAQHRVMAAMLREDVTEVPCVVFKAHAVSEEARAFVGANTAKAPTAVAKFKANCIAGLPESLLVQELVQQSGRTVAQGGKADMSGTVGCVSQLQTRARKDPEELRRVWPLIAKLCEGGPIYSEIVSAIFYIEGRMASGSLTDQKWSNRLLMAGCKRVVEKMEGARKLRGNSKPPTLAEGLLEVLNRGLSPGARLVLPDRKARSEPENVVRSEPENVVDEPKAAP